MESAAKAIVTARQKVSKGGLHEVRVSVRRCRTIAQGLGDCASAPLYRKIDSLGKKLFRKTNPLRDAQVRIKWAGKLFRKTPSACRTVVKELKKCERSETRRVVKALRDFPLKKWKKLAVRLAAGEGGRLSEKSLQAEAGWMALSIRRFDRKARKTGDPKDYHRLRISFKQYRYFAEAFFPEGEQGQDEDRLKAVQDALGEAHDLAGLAEFLSGIRGKLEKKDLETLMTALDRQSRASLRRYWLLHKSSPQKIRPAAPASEK